MGREPEGFREFVSSRRLALLRRAVLLTGDQGLAEDLVQTSLLKVWPRWEQLAREGDPDAYLRRVMVNTSVSWWRRPSHHERLSASLPETATASDDYTTSDNRDLLDRALCDLPRRQRAVIVLRYYEDLSEAQAAGILDCSVGTVKSQTSRALEKLRRLIPSEAWQLPEEVPGA